MTPLEATRTGNRRPGAGHAASIRPRAVPRLPRRVSGPAPGHPPARSGSAAARGARVLDRLRALPDARLLDRLVRGPAWIVLVGGLLIGIVAMQVSLLRLNAGIGRAVAQSANLERRNGELRAAVSRLSAEQRLRESGRKLGLVMPDVGQVRFVAVRTGADARRAAEALRAGRLGPGSVTEPEPNGPVGQADGSQTVSDPATATATAQSTAGATLSEPAAPEPAAADDRPADPSTGAAADSALAPGSGPQR